MHRGNFIVIRPPRRRAPAPRGRHSDCDNPSPARHVLQCTHHGGGGVTPSHTPWHLQIDDGTARHVSIGRHAHTYEDAAIVATTLDGNPRLRVLVQRCGRLVPAAWREAHLESRYSSIACSLIRLVTRIGKTLDKLVV